MKLTALSDAGFRLWACGLIFCQANLTDGFIPQHVIHTFGVKARRVGEIALELTRPIIAGKGPLWHVVEGGYQVHDYLEWNESREEVELNRRSAKQRMVLFQNPFLRNQIRERDGDRCRYCGVTVRWNDRKGPQGGTYDHVEPHGGNTIENLVVACRGCNASKGRRNPTEAKKKLLDPIKKISKSESSSEQATTTTTTTTKRKIKSGRETAAPTRALLTLFDAEHVKRFGSKAAIRGGKDGQLLADLWRQRQGDPVTVEALIGAFFTSRDPWLDGKGFTVGLFVSQLGKLVAAVSSQVAPAEYWRDECRREHGGTCQGQYVHGLKMRPEAS